MGDVEELRFFSMFLFSSIDADLPIDSIDSVILPTDQVPLFSFPYWTQSFFHVANVQTWNVSHRSHKSDERTCTILVLDT